MLKLALLVKVEPGKCICRMYFSEKRAEIIHCGNFVLKGFADVI